jgi:Winged helix DNA-binding domain
MATAPLDLSREQILGFRRRAQALDERLPLGPESLRRAAWAGLQDSMPRAASLSIHARVAGAGPSSWEDPSLVQLWGPRYSAYVVAARDLAYFSLGRLPDEPKSRKRSEDLAARLHAFLGGRRMRYDDAGVAMGVHPNSLRYAAQTGTVVIRWEGARRPLVWTVPRPEIEPLEARIELASRYIHFFGPTNAAAFAKWAGIGSGESRAAFEGLAGSLVPVRTPIGDGLILADDEAAFRAPVVPAASARLLPSGDSYFLLQGADRELLVPEADRRERLWTPRVWPGAVLLDGEIVGTWRRAGADVAVETWRVLSAGEHSAVSAEAESLPLPDLHQPVRVQWPA